jgi:signal transduction histidine kinase
MRTSRVILLLAASLLVAAELITMSLLLKGLGEHQAQRTSAALDRAMMLMPRIAEWARGSLGSSGEAINAQWVEPFDQLAVVDPKTLELAESDRRRIDSGELVVLSKIQERLVIVAGMVRAEGGPRYFKLTETAVDESRLAADRILIAQHTLVLLAAAIGLVLAALARAPAESDDSPPALRAYEEAMSRLRRRDDERLAGFEREKSALASVLKDREAMARAGELTAGIVHEMGNSLAAITTHAQFAADSKDERSQKAGLAVIEESRYAQSAMARFVDFIRTETMQEIDFDLSRLVARVAARESAQRGVRIDLAGSETRVVGDEDLLERAIENVVRNAAQAVGEGGRISVKFGADSTHAFVIVEDDGPGIKDPNKALRPFESTRPGGLGLGLPLVLKILSLHQGTLDIGENGRGVGCQVVCRWPKSVRAATSGNPPPPTPSS